MPPTLLRSARAVLGASLAAFLVACGGSGDDSGDGDARLRVLNVSNDIASVDLYTEAEDDDSAELRSAGVARDGVSEYVRLDADTYDLELRRGGADAALLSQNDRALAADDRTTLVVYGHAGSYGSALLAENEDEDDLDSGKAGLRVFNAARDAGSLDVYLTATDTPLSEASPNVAALDGASLGGFTQIAGGSYRLRVTAAGDESDLRLDVPVVALETGSLTTLVLTSGDGGVLVHGHLLAQGGALVLAKNTAARVRVAASVPDSAAVDVRAGATTLADDVRAPSVGSYALVDAGELTLNVSVNDGSVAAPAFTAEAGADYTLLVAGEGATTEVVAIEDDNRRPEGSGRAKIRLVNALSGDTGGLTLSVDFDAVATGTRFATASAPTEIDSGSDIQLQVTSPLDASPIYSASEVTIASQAVYTVFILSGQAQPSGVLRKER